MNMHVTARDVRTLAEQIANRKAVRERLYGPSRSVNITEKQIAPPPPPKAPPAHGQVWRFLYSQFDQHVWDYHRYMRDMSQPLRAYARKRAEQLGVDFNDLLSHKRFRHLVFPRQLIMWEIKTVYRPSSSYPEIGRLFSHRDHTTVLHSVRKIQAMKDKGEL